MEVSHPQYSDGLDHGTHESDDFFVLTEVPVGGHTLWPNKGEAETNLKGEFWGLVFGKRVKVCKIHTLYI